MEFFGTDLEVTPPSRLVWTNEEGDNGKTVTTVTFAETAGETVYARSKYTLSFRTIQLRSPDGLPSSMGMATSLRNVVPSTHATSI